MSPVDSLAPLLDTTASLSPEDTQTYNVNVSEEVENEEGAVLPDQDEENGGMPPTLGMSVNGISQDNAMKNLLI
jgi:hypothetical protein